MNKWPQKSELCHISNLSLKINVSRVYYYGSRMNARLQLTDRGIGLGLLTPFLGGIGFESSSSEEESFSSPTAEGPLFMGQR